VVNLKGRLQRLERQHTQVSREPLRFVVSRAGKPLDLSKATCTRTIMPDGRLMEYVDLNGGDYGLSEEDLEEFIQSHPIEGHL
jgi:hypothetical protein